MTNNSSRNYKYLDLVIAFFAVVLVTSNIASSAKIVDLGFSIFGIRLAFDGGTLMFPVSYIIGDLLTEVYGFRISRKAIWTGFIVLAVSSLFFFILGVLPGEAAWESYAGSSAYKAILGGMSSGGIVLASLTGYLAGGFSNSVILSRMKVLMKGRFLWARTIGSSLVGELVDSLAFVGIATLAGIFTRELFFSLVITNYLLKLFLEVILTPLTYLTVWKLKRAEGIDAYDIGVKLNPFKLG